MARDHPGVGGQGVQHRGDVPRVALHAPAGGQVDEGELPREHVVPHVDHVRSGEEDHRVPVGVAPGEVLHPDLLAVQVDRDALPEGDVRQRPVGQRRRGVAPHHLRLGQPLADVVVRDDRRLPAERLVAVRVVVVPVRVQHPVHPSAAQRVDRRPDPRGQGLELVVHEQHAVLPEGDADVAAPPLDHVDAPRDVRDGDLHVVRLLGGRGPRHQEDGHQGRRDGAQPPAGSIVVSPHGSSFVVVCARACGPGTSRPPGPVRGETSGSSRRPQGGRPPPTPSTKKGGRPGGRPRRPGRDVSVGERVRTRP